MAECHCGMCEHCTPTLTQAFPAAKGHYATFAPELAEHARVVAKALLAIRFPPVGVLASAYPSAERILELVGDE